MYFGIDLGTSNSAIASVREGKVRIFKTPEGTDVMPSVIHRDQRGRQIVGVRAADRASLSPENAIDGFKRMIGTNTPCRFTGTGETMTPEQASTEILRSLIGQALVEAGGDTVTGVVVTIPAAFGQLQTEATLTAARAAGLDRVALLQEPVAAALAAMAGSRERNGQFLIYDLGGGTFDTALVQAIDGEVDVLAHDGVNMLGGRDLDRRIMDNVVLPWLRQKFELPADFVNATPYERLRRIVRRATEVAKIALSTRDETTVSASDDEVRLEDLNGEPLYLDVPMTRQMLEDFGAEMVEKSLKCCRDMLARQNLRHEDVSRLVLIGGPTKMPFLRRRVEEGLGIPVEDMSRVDPMTAVAIGAAIYCEGRDWSATGSAAKATHRREDTAGVVTVAYEYEARTASDVGHLRVFPESGTAGAEISIESFLGWSSGRHRLDKPLAFELPLRDMGANRFRSTVFGADGVPVGQASREIVVERLLASTGGVPATQAIAVKIRDNNDRNTLDVVIRKGTILPATGVVPYRLAEPLRPGQPHWIRIELYQIMDETLPDISLHLLVGEFQIVPEDLPQAAALRKGDAVRVHWAMSEGQTLSVEVELPTVGQRFGNEKFYNWQMAKQDFSGEAGANLAAMYLEKVEFDLSQAEEVMPPGEAASLEHIREELDRRMRDLRGSLDAEMRRSLVERAMALRCDIARTCNHPVVQRDLLRRKLAVQRKFYDQDIRPDASRSQIAEAENLFGAAHGVIEQSGNTDFVLANDIVAKVASNYWRQGLTQDGFCVRQFLTAKKAGHLATDKAKFQRLVVAGERALAAGDMKAVREAYIDIILDRPQIGGDGEASAMSSLTKH